MNYVRFILVFFKRFFLCGPFSKVFIEFVTVLFLCFCVLDFGPWGMWNFSSQTKDWIHTPCIVRWSLNHWTTGKSLFYSFLLSSASGKYTICQSWRHKRCGFDPWVRKIPWRRAWQSTPVFMPGESHGQRSLVGYSQWGSTESDTTEAT